MSTDTALANHMRLLQAMVTALPIPLLLQLVRPQQLIGTVFSRPLACHWYHVILLIRNLNWSNIQYHFFVGRPVPAVSYSGSHAFIRHVASLSCWNKHGCPWWCLDGSMCCSKTCMYPLPWAPHTHRLKVVTTWLVHNLPIFFLPLSQLICKHIAGIKFRENVYFKINEADGVQRI